MNMLRSAFGEQSVIERLILLQTRALERKQAGGVLMRLPLSVL
ncbi:hypothetical protein [Bacillus licheniformis]|nr:hypothetical protein [Bacillus licheniformis]